MGYLLFVIGKNKKSSRSAHRGRMGIVIGYWLFVICHWPLITDI